MKNIIKFSLLILCFSCLFLGCSTNTPSHALSLGTEWEFDNNKITMIAVSVTNRISGSSHKEIKNASNGQYIVVEMKCDLTDYSLRDISKISIHPSDTTQDDFTYLSDLTEQVNGYKFEESEKKNTTIKLIFPMQYQKTSSDLLDLCIEKSGRSYSESFCLYN